MSLNTIPSSQCFDSSRVINPEEHETFIKENTCLFCNKLASDICQCQLGCGGLFGYGCFSASNIDSCPKCLKSVEQDKSQYKNRYINKLVSQQVQLKCINHGNGCPEVLPYSSEDVARHEAVCQYYTVQCDKKSSGCAWEGGKANLEEHAKTCDFHEYVCEQCETQGEEEFKFLKNTASEHQKTCLNVQTEKVLANLDQSESKMNQQVYKLLKEQQSKIALQNRRTSELINYAVSLEKTEERKRDKRMLLSDFKNGIINFNSLDNLQTTLDNVEHQSVIRGVKLNDTNLSCYEYSFSSKKDFAKTVRKIEQYAAAGDKSSQYSLARLYYWGDKDIPQNIEKTEEWNAKALEQNSSEAYWLMGDLYFENKGKQGQDFQKAFKYYEQAASMGNAEATNSLGQMYDDGEGYPSNEKIALQCFQKSASLGDYGGLYNLAVYHQEGYGGLPKNPEKAFFYYMLSAKKGDIDAMKRVAILLKQGKGVERDLQESDKWAKKAGYYNNKYSPEIPSTSTMTSLTSMNSQQYTSEQVIRSDVI